MKKLALLLAALSVASVSYAKEVMPEAAPVVEEVVVEQEVVEVKAAPVLRVTSIGQALEIDNTSGAEDIGEAVHLANTVGLAIGDNWTFELMARKTWSASMDDYVKDGKTYSDGMKSAGHRVDLSATRHFENFAVGLKWRTEEDIEKFYIPVSYNYGMVSGWATPAFVNYDNKSSDAWYLEAMPVIVKYGPVALGYYFEGEEETGSGDEHFADHQVRLMLDLYSTDNFRLGAEYWYQFASEHKEYKVAKKAYEEYENNKHVAVLSAAYDLTQNLTVDGYYRYDFNKYDGLVNVTKADDYYGEFCVGWTYNF